jgi:hypothetical protein
VREGSTKKMMNTSAFLTLVSLVPATSAVAQVPRADPTGHLFGVCEVLASPLRFDGSVIRVRGKVGSTDEGEWLVGDECRGIFVTGAVEWPSEIALVMPTIPPSLRLHSPDFTYDWAKGKRIDAKRSRLLRSGGSPDCLMFTLTGLFETRREWVKHKYPDGTSKFIGFGHQNEAPAQLLLKSSDDVELIQNCKAKSAK